MFILYPETREPIYRMADLELLHPSRGIVAWPLVERLGPPESLVLDAYFGNEVDVSGDDMVVGAIGKDAAYIYHLGGDGWTLAARLSPEDMQSGDRFGSGVAISGDEAIIGAQNAEDGSGAAYVFLRDAEGRWQQEAKLKPSDESNGALFGWSGGVAISGNDAIVCSNTGVFFFRRSGRKFEEIQRVIGEFRRGDETVFHGFRGVAMDAGRAVIGDGIANDHGRASGAAHIYVRGEDGVWRSEARLLAPDGAAGDVFGDRVAISGDLVLVGAKNHDEKGEDSGAAYLFRRKADGSGWGFEKKLVPKKARAGDGYGGSVALTGNVALVGGYRFCDDPARACSMAPAVIFENVGKGWGERAVLSVSETVPGFATSVALRGSTAIIGARQAPPNNAGAVFIYQD
ncbi:MAG: hypothetical protein A2018_03730 [Alphaproteobacteria bacterium GWF2_58_20]|nr:MAG: hypothetical protein A2018_03730 [Alphaproteobacteria bacterium GWF2_58_20]